MKFIQVLFAGQGNQHDKVLDN